VAERLRVLRWRKSRRSADSHSPVARHTRVPGYLLHPRLVGMNGDPSDSHPAALEMDEEQHVVGHQPAQRQHLCGEEVSARQQRQVGPNEGLCLPKTLSTRGCP
jgi:hypothetical protein